jgi:hypothetical protein
LADPGYDSESDSPPDAPASPVLRSALRRPTSAEPSASIVVERRSIAFAEGADSLAASTAAAARATYVALTDLRRATQELDEKQRQVDALRALYTQRRREYRRCCNEQGAALAARTPWVQPFVLELDGMDTAKTNLPRLDRIAAKSSQFVASKDIDATTAKIDAWAASNRIANEPK